MHLLEVVRSTVRHSTARSTFWWFWNWFDGPFKRNIPFNTPWRNIKKDALSVVLIELPFGCDLTMAGHPVNNFHFLPILGKNPRRIPFKRNRGAIPTIRSLDHLKHTHGRHGLRNPGTSHNSIEVLPGLKPVFGPHGSAPINARAPPEVETFPEIIPIALVIGFGFGRPSMSMRNFPWPFETSKNQNTHPSLNKLITPVNTPRF